MVFSSNSINNTIKTLVFFSLFSMNPVWLGSDFSSLGAEEASGGLPSRGGKTQDGPIERDLSLTLDDLYHGCTKKIKISRRVRTVVTRSHSSPWRPISRFIHPFISLIECRQTAVSALFCIYSS